MLGIDVSKATVTATLLVSRDQPPLWVMTVQNTPAGITRLIRRRTPESAWVVEPTGRYSQALVAQAHAARRVILLAQPKWAKDFLAAIQPHAKADRPDGYGLALWSCRRLITLPRQE